MRSSKFNIWFYLFLFFEFIFLVMNVLNGWNIIDALIRSSLSTAVLIVFIYVIYRLIFSKSNEGLKGNAFDKKDSNK